MKVVNYTRVHLGLLFIATMDNYMKAHLQHCSVFMRIVCNYSPKRHLRDNEEEM